MTIISIVNQKGGVGKTTSSVNFASFLSKTKRTLLVDLDPQGNSTTGIGIEKQNLKSSIYDVIVGEEEIENSIIEIKENLSIVPAKIDLAGAEIELVGKMSRERKLKKALDSVEDKYDVVLIDCPPSLGLLTINALTASEYVIIPIQCEFYALEGLSQLLNTIKLVNKELNKELKLFKVLLTMYDKRLKLTEEVANEVKEYFKEKVFETIIPRNIKLTEAPSYGKAIDDYALNSTGSKAYEEAVKEVIESGIIR